MSESIEGIKRTGYCGDYRIDDVGKEVVLCGWAQKQRDLGQLIFIDLRDRTGIIQLAFDDETDKEVFDKAFGVRAEYVLRQEELSVKEQLKIKIYKLEI